MKRKSTLVDSVSAEPEVSAVGRKQQFPQSNSANSAVGKKLSIVNCTLLIVFCLFFGGKVWGQTTNQLLSENFDAMSSISTSYSANGWYAYNAGSGNNWTLNTSSSYANSGSNSAQVQYNSSYAANCYLVSAPFTVSSNMTELSVSLYECVRSSSYTEQFEVFFVKASDVTSLSAVASATKYNAISSASYTNTSYAQMSGTVTSPALKGQSVRVVVHCTSAADQWYLYIDDLTVTETITTGPYVTLSPSSATILTGFTQSLTASYGNVSGTPTITYTSSNTSVATVSGSGTSATVTAVAPGTCTITATMTYQGNNYTATCAITVEDPSYCEPSFSEPSDDYISNFATSGGTTNINNTSNYVSSGYSDYYNNNSVSIEAGATLTCTVTSSSTQWEYGHAIWVDWNKDYEFTSDEIVAYTSSTATGNWTGSFVVPANIAAGDYRMRVIHLYDETPTNPCMSDDFGEAEDYKLTVIASCLAPTNVTVTNVTEHSVSLEWTPRGIATQWIIVWDREEYASTHPAWRNYITTTATSYTITDYAEVVDIEHTGSLTPGTEYRFRVFSDCGDPLPNAPDVNATTESACPKPTNVTVSNLAPSRATVSWESNAGNYTVRYSTATITGTTLMQTIMTLMVIQTGRHLTQVNFLQEQRVIILAVILPCQEVGVQVLEM